MNGAAVIVEVHRGPPAGVPALGGAEVVVLSGADAERVAAAADALVGACLKARVAVFVGEPGPALEEFCAELFAAPAQVVRW